ncbi:expressed unknown protein [Seminavis robusta]|uniref:DUF1995 domain-containing protein n=1 Tax=Seminavis robusta TaxID=568900 RepID=A0A9N8EG58_9STRA|nr:expressed unknown protein [Seminavis robusta]|eukprot:Sro1141_g245620.1 n/a (372) ;mRNA; r:11170-12543
MVLVSIIGGHVLLLLLCASRVSGFAISPSTFGPRENNGVTSKRLLPIWSSSGDDESSDGSSIDAMRQMLEGSWNSEMMGLLPADPEDAANEAGGSLMTAKERGQNVVMINLLLPSYDITMGSNVYDEVEAVNFCVALSKFLDETDSADDSKKEELDDFRQQLMADWGEDEPEDEPSDEVQGDISDSEELPAESEPPQPEAEAEPSFRMASMFGDATFKKGPDMFDKVIEAVSFNAQPNEDEDTLVILSASSEEETIGVRALVAKFEKTKTILLVNCQFNPVPRELMKAETIYYLLPLVAKPKEASTQSEGSMEQPKVVVLRRFPRDFEVYMDFGKGFELTESVGVNQVGRTGPTLEWVAGRVKRQMDARSF